MNHNKFGSGTIIAQSPSTVTVKFMSESKAKKFLYPSAFNFFLKLQNSSTKEQMDSELLSIKTTAEVEQNIRLMEKEKMRAMLEAKNAPKKRAPARKKLLPKSKAEKNEEA